MGLQKGQELELVVESTAHGGAGVARADRFVVFVKGGVPGDRVRARIYRKKRGFAEAGILELLDPSQDRVEPRCPYSGYCGGCQWQHVSYERQLEYKKMHVKDAVERIGGLKGVEINHTKPSPEVWGYRNKMEFSFTDRRWLLPEELARDDVDRGFALGLHVPGTFNKVIDVDGCLLQPRYGNLILGAVKRAALDSGLPPYGLKTHVGFWRFLTLRRSTARDEWMVNLVTSESRMDVVHPMAAELCSELSRIRTVVNSINSRRASVAVGEKERVLAGDGVLEDMIGPFSFRISADSFFQTNTRGAELLYETVAGYAGLTGGEKVVDLYSGTGTISIFLSRAAGEVIGLELTQSAVADAEANCSRNGVDNCRFIQGDVRETLKEVGQVDVMVIDPPRAGLHKEVVSGVKGLACRRIVYVSCNPATLARDLGSLAHDYDVVQVQPLDMFPHTYHVEAVALLERKHC
ncbi:MAG: 23S rRNA (uracil(1939)-C(5))-methyltransferase RlmD [Desulfobacteraceae bacterium]